MTSPPVPGTPSWGEPLNTYLLENFAALDARLDALGSDVPATVLSVGVSGNTITLSWAGVIGATGYLVGRNGTDEYGTVGTPAQVSSSVTSQVFGHLIYDTEYIFTVQPLPTGGVSSVRATTSNPPATTTTTTVTVTDVGNNTATLNWTPVTGATGYLVGRDGTDTTGSGPWSTTDPPSATSRVFNGLVNNTVYNLYCEPQGTGLPAYPAAGHGRRTATATGTAPAPPAGQTVVSTGAITNTSIVLNWTAVAGATGYLVGRDGVDSGGSGAFQTTVGSGVTSQTFLNLVPGNPYTLFCTPQPAGQQKTITTATTVTPGTPGTPPAGTGVAWLSGTCGTDPAQRTQFDTWRGEPQTYIRTWTDNNSANMGLVGYYLNSFFGTWTNGTVDLAMGGPGYDGTSWANAASGSMDTMWRNQCQSIHANWNNLKCVHLSMSHELNGNWMPWSVNSTNVANFKTAWQRYHAIVTQELKNKGRNVKVVINYAAGQNLVDAMYPGNAYIDIIGFDSYDMWMPTSTGNIRTESDWTTFQAATTSDGSPWGFETFAAYALSKGKPFTVPEWGLSASTQFEYDNPFYIQKVYDWLKTKAPVDKDNPAAGKCAGDAYFNTWTQTQLWPTTTKPLAAARYQSLKWGSTV